MVHSPNVLWIVTTQWRAQAFGFAGDSNARTPHLDQFASESVNYTQAVTPHPFGPFARAAMLTGRWSPENGVSDYFDPLPTGSRTIAHDFSQRGYKTAYFGKWHLAQRDRRAPLVGETHARQVVPEEQRGGFDFWEGFESGFLLNDPWLHGSRIPVPRQFSGYQSDVLCRRGAEFLQGISHGHGETQSACGQSERIVPWFLIVSLEAPHPPYDAPAGDIRSPDPMRVLLRPNVPRNADVEARARCELAGYYAHIEATDRAIGGLLAAVDRKDTTVIFTSVHGDMHGSHGLFRKGWPYDEAVRVPLLVRHPAGQQVGAGTDDSAVSIGDLRRLTAAWIDQRREPELFGSSFISMPSVVRLPHQCDRVWRGLRTRDRKLILDAAGEPWLFFNLEKDPFELENLVSDRSHAAELTALRSELDRIPG